MKNRRAGKISKFGAIALCGCAVLLVLLVVLLRWRGGSPGSEVPFAQLPASEQERRRAAVNQLEAQTKDIAGKARRKEKAPFTLTVTQEQLNTILQDRLRTEKAPLHDLQAQLSPGTLSVQGNVDYKGVTVPASLSGSLSAQNGQVTFRTESLTLSGLPAPRALKERVEKDINHNLNRGLTQAPVHIESVTVEAGQLTIAGTTD